MLKEYDLHVNFGCLHLLNLWTSIKSRYPKRCDFFKIFIMSFAFLQMVLNIYQTNCNVFVHTLTKCLVKSKGK